MEQAGVRGDTALPAAKHLKASQPDMFGKELRLRLLASSSPLAKSYPNILGDELAEKLICQLH